MQDFLSTVILLFIVIDPVGLAPMIQGMLKKYSPAQQKAILMRELVFALTCCSCSSSPGNSCWTCWGWNRPP